MLNTAATPSLADTYEQRKVDQVCTYPSRVPCSRPLAEDSQLCERHLRRARRSKRDSARRVRADRRELGLCADGCGARSARYRCAACSIRTGRIPTTGVDTTVDNSPAPDRQWRAGTHESDATTKRYRGRAKRGKPPAATLDDQDLRDAIDALEKARRALTYARSPEVVALPRIQRESALRAALDYVKYAGRFEDDVLDRNKISR
jgi:hypothetical protein